jgi:hypothetical protein
VNDGQAGIIGQGREPVCMGTNYYDHRDILDAKRGIHRFRQQRFTVEFEQLFGSAKPTALPGGQDDDGGIVDI